MNFRRVVTALAVLALFVAVASAQEPIPQSMSCTVSAATNPSLRAEGIAEKVGDVILTCTASVTPQTSTADRATIAVNFGVPVTSNPIGSGVESVLTVDEPNTVTTSPTFAGYGANAPISVCSVATNTTATACPAFYYNVIAPNTFGTAGAIYAVASSTAGGAAQNVYQGTVGTSGSGLQTVTFANVPVVLPGQANIQRIYRITNVRVTPSGNPIAATVTVTSASNAAVVLTLANNGVTVGTPATSLVTAVNSVTGAESLCVSPSLNAPAVGAAYTKANLAILQFKEGFNNAFKTRVLPNTTNAAGDAQSSNPLWQQNVQGSYTVGKVTYTSAASESGTFIPTLGATAGLANTGTRLKAVFAGLDKNATYYVSTTNITDYQTLATVPTVGAGDASNIPYAVLLNSQGFSNENQGYTYATSTLNGNGVVPVVAVSRASDGSAEVIWEVTNDKVGSANTYNFALYAVYNPVSAAPTVGNTATVTLGYAVTNGSSTTSPVGNTTTAIPRFNTPAMTPANFFNVVLCQTTLLFPYVTNSNGFETGLAVSNTSMDPFGTPATTGACSLYFYGANQPSGAITLTNPSGASTIASGQQIANTVSGLGLSGFQGYTIAVCNFQYGHGFAFLQTTKGTLSMGYLGLVMNSTGRGQTLVGEGFQQ